MSQKDVKPGKRPAPTKSVTDHPQDRPDRMGKRLVAAHFQEDVARQLKVLAALEGRTVQSLLSEALGLLFRVHAKQLSRITDAAPGHALAPGRKRRATSKVE